jgi:hypothetical protein
MAKKVAGKAKAASKTNAKGKAAPKKKKAAKRELIDTGNDKRFVRRDELGQFNEVDNVGRSLSQDRKRKAKTVAKRGQGDKGDRPTASKRSGTKRSATKRSATKRSTKKKSGT